MDDAFGYDDKPLVVLLFQNQEHAKYDWTFEVPLIADSCDKANKLVEAPSIGRAMELPSLHYDVVYEVLEASVACQL